MKGSSFFKNRLIFAGSVIVIFLLCSALLGPLIFKQSPFQTNLEKRLQPPSTKHPFGTDQLGRDILARTLYGARISLCVCLVATLLSTTIGVTLGIIAGYYGGRLDRLISALIDITLSFPSLLLAIAIATSLGPGILNLLIALALVGWACFARLIRGTVLSLKERTFIHAAMAIGCSDIRIIFKHILPNCLNIIIVWASLRMGIFILTEAALSFLGLGAQPPIPTWGSMISLGRDYIRVSPYIVIFPGLAIAAATIGFNLIGEGLRNKIDIKIEE